tara:strand:- start:531 stop:1316 length:786 start_codon:yes stop_codon:yes gene_type:complete
MSLSTDLNTKYGRSYLTFEDVDRAQKDISVFDDGMNGNLSSSEEEVFVQLMQSQLINPDNPENGFFIVDEDEVVEGMTSASKNASAPKETLEFEREINTLKQQAEDKGLLYVTKAEFDLSNTMATRLKKSFTWQNALSGQHFGEIFSSSTVDSGTFSGEVNTISGSIVSFKQTPNEADEWESEISSKNYDMEAYINYMATGKSTYWIVQETTAPYLAAFYKSGTTILNAGKTKLGVVLTNIQDFLDDYPTDPDEYAYSKTL